MITKMETSRLILRPFETEDLASAHQWFGDAEVMRYTPMGPDQSRETTRERLAGYRKHQALHGFSKWAIALPNGELIGDAGLLVLEETGEIELGFRLARTHWGCGYASEVAKAWVRAAHERFSIHRITAFSHPDNAASHRVLEKAGFSVRNRGVVMGMPAVSYVLELSQTMSQ
jgi:ribosomal-protein-alanine N-acetyltransferase